MDGTVKFIGRACHPVLADRQDDKTAMLVVGTSLPRVTRTWEQEIILIVQLLCVHYKFAKEIDCSWQM